MHTPALTDHILGASAQKGVATATLPIRVHFERPGASQAVADALYHAVRPQWRSEGGLVVLCIGTDRSTGDALGPLVGRRLQSLICASSTPEVIGSLDAPVHASNLHDVLRDVTGRLPAPLIVAVDACLGRLDSVGTVTVGTGPLTPGAGVNKCLPEVGAAYVTGTVNVGGFMEYFVLQNTRLSLVVRMAEVIADGFAELGHRLAGLGAPLVAPVDAAALVGA